MSIVVEAAEIGKAYGGFWGLRRASFHARERELLVLLGPNGAGKTTTSKIFATVLKPSRGRASILGLDSVRDHEAIRKKISYLPQEHELAKDLTPLESLTWNLMARGTWTLSDARHQAKKWLDTLGIWDLRNKLCWTLSGGQKRRVAVALTLSSESEVVLLDEPTVGLDVEIKHTVWKALRETVSLGATMLLTTHDMDEAETISDRVVVIDSGETIIEDEPRNLVKNLPYKYRIIAAKDAANQDILPRLSDSRLDLGDRIVFYSKSHADAMSLVDLVTRDSRVYSVGEVSLEDAYVYILNRKKKLAKQGTNEDQILGLFQDELKQEA